MDPQQIKEIQNKLLDLIIYFDSFCNKHGIEYYLDAGNAIGAMRYNDFIPWDDDFDVMMTKENYDSFIKIAQIELDCLRFYLQKEDTKEFPLLFSKLRMNGTTYIEEENKNSKMHKGFFIDIFCLYNMSQNRIWRNIQYVASKILLRKSTLKLGHESRNLAKRIIMLVTYLFNKKLLWTIINSQKNIETNLVGHLFAVGVFRKRWFPRVYLGKQRHIKYGNLILPVADQVEKYLTQRYGDFMKTPDDMTKNKYPSHVIFYDTTVDYKKYEDQNSRFIGGKL